MRGRRHLRDERIRALQALAVSGSARHVEKTIGVPGGTLRRWAKQHADELAGYEREAGDLLGEAARRGVALAINVAVQGLEAGEPIGAEGAARVARDLATSAGRLALVGEFKAKLRAAVERELAGFLEACRCELPPSSFAIVQRIAAQGTWEAPDDFVPDDSDLPEPDPNIDLGPVGPEPPPPVHGWERNGASDA